MKGADAILVVPVKLEDTSKSVLASPVTPVVRNERFRCKRVNFADRGFMRTSSPGLVRGPHRARAGALGCALLLGFALVAGHCGGVAASEAEIRQAVMAQLDPEQQAAFQSYLSAQRKHSARVDAYWGKIEDLKRARSVKRKARQIFTLDDYVLEFPPEYKGPQLSARIQKLLAAERQRRETPTVPDKSQIPSVSDFLDHARRHYSFVPERISEVEFKRRYAREALKHGLGKEQVVRVYALETGGRGTYDMQAGIHPIKRTGQPISTALGYAQLLSANSISELVKHGGAFASRLEAMASAPGVSEARRKELRQKVKSVQAMRRVARSVENDWWAHMRLARTGKGMAIHALNIDGDVGPWLQVIKLDGLQEIAATWGMRNLTGAELELMNLAGPRTGLEMMQPLVWDAPTSNFFSRGGYYRNSVVRGRTARELMLELDKRIDAALANDGAKEFAAAFDHVQRTASNR